MSPDQRRVTLFYDPPLPQSARVRVTIDGDAITNVDGEPVDADGDGEAGGRRLVDFDTLGLTQIPDTIVTGRVFASETGDGGENVPLEGVTIRVDGMPELKVTTDEFGKFRLVGAPAGRFFVHIDGTTVDVPKGYFYPTVGKPFRSVPGREVELPNDIHLPLIEKDALRPVSETEDVTVGLTENQIQKFLEANKGVDRRMLEATQLTVLAGTLFADDGEQGGMAGLELVAPDRIPGRLPEGVDLPFVLTVQTDGQERRSDELRSARARGVSERPATGPRNQNTRVLIQPRQRRLGGNRHGHGLGGWLEHPRGRRGGHPRPRLARNATGRLASIGPAVDGLQGQPLLRSRLPTGYADSGKGLFAEFHARSKEFGENLEDQRHLSDRGRLC